MKKYLLPLFTLFAILLVPVLALAQAPGAEDPVGLFGFLFAKVQSGEWLPAFGAGLMLLVYLARKGLGSKFGWFKTKLGGYTLSFGISLAGAVGTAALAGKAISLSLVITALGVAWAAAGGWEQFRDVVSYYRKKKEAKEAKA